MWVDHWKHEKLKLGKGIAFGVISILLIKSWGGGNPHKIIFIEENDVYKAFSIVPKR